MEQLLVSGLDPFLHGPFQCLFAGDVVGAEAVVVEGEDGADEGALLVSFRSGIRPGHEVVFGGQDSIVASDLDASLVLGLALEFALFLADGGGGRSVELMVSGDPEDMLEAADGFAKCDLQMLYAFADCRLELGARRMESRCEEGGGRDQRTVSSQNQAVVAAVLELCPFVTVGLERQMDVSDGP